MYEYRATLLRVIDGDTIDVAVDLGFFVSHRRTLRLRGVNTPELNDRDPAVRAKAFAAKQFMINRLPRTDNGIIVRTHKDQDDKYGRMLADVLVGQSLVNQELIDHGLAIPYMT